MHMLSLNFQRWHQPPCACNNWHRFHFVGNRFGSRYDGRLCSHACLLQHASISIMARGWLQSVADIGTTPPLSTDDVTTLTAWPTVLFHVALTLPLPLPLTLTLKVWPILCHYAALRALCGRSCCNSKTLTHFIMMGMYQTHGARLRTEMYNRGCH
jgi:hypothetical protein